MDPEKPEGGLSRLGRAFEAYFRNQETSGAADTETLLRNHGDLRDLLEPMLAGPRTPDAPPSVAERIVGDYRIVREIGRGGMGVVFEAQQISLDRFVALKVLPGDGTLQPSSLARFRREAMTAASVSHDGIVKVFGVGSQGGTHYFAMELVEGAPLDKVIETLRGTPWESLRGSSIEAAVQRWKHTRSGSSSGEREAPAGGAGRSAWTGGYVETVVGFVVQVADALEHAHRAGIIHRDVKPSNILVKPDGRAVLSDFGLARQEALPGVTQAGGLTGTPYYVSPEQSLGRGAGVGSDVFSLGVTLYELLTLRRPFEGETIHQVLAKVQGHEPAAPQKANPFLPDDLVAVLLKALEKEPEQRYATAAAFAADLRAFIAYRPVTARRASRVARLRRWVKREPLKATLAAVLVLSVPLLCGLGTYVLMTRVAASTGREKLLRDGIESSLAEGFVELYRQGDARLSVAAFARALELEPGNVEALAGTALAWSRTGNHENALAIVDAASVERHPALKRVRAEALRAADKKEEAAALESSLVAPAEPLDLFLAGEQELERARRRDDKAGGRRALDLLSRAMLMTREARQLLYYARALAARAAGDDKATRDVVAALQKHWPDDDRTWFMVGTLLRDSDPEAAATSLRRFLARHPDHMHAHAALATCLDRTKDIEGAIAECREAARLAPSDAAVLVALGIILAGANRRVEAEDVFRNAITVNPKSATAHLNLGSVLLGRHDEEGALACFREAIALAPELTLAHLALGNVFLHRDDYAASVASYRRALELSPDYAEAWYGMGCAEVMRGDLAAAISAYEKMIEVEPRAAGRIRHVLALIFEGKEKPEQVVELLKKLDETEARTESSRPSATRPSPGEQGR